MQRYFIQLAYNGTDFHGWQRQENANSVQQEIEDKLSVLFQNKIEILGCGRTDTGVHASEYFAHVDFDKEINESELTYKLNCMLPKSIAIHKILKVIPEAHARFDAVARSYEYYISKVKDPFKTDLVYEFKNELNVDAMNSCCNYLLTVSDFKSFCKIGSDVKTTNCDVRIAKWVENEKNYIFYITADRFLRNMVRAIVGTLLDVGLGKISENDFKQIVSEKNRNVAGSSAPASGLFLSKVEYPKSIYL